MKTLKMLITIASITIFLAGVNIAFAGNFKIMTEEYPPYNFTDNGKLTGLSSDVVTELTKRVGNSGDIEVLPWARAYGLIQNGDGLALFSMTRTEAREDMFKWVGPLAPNKYVLFAKKGSGVTVGSLEDAKKVGKVGTYKDSAGENLLKELGFPNTESVLDDSQNIPKLMAGRINLWVAGELVGIHKAKLSGEADQLEVVLELKDTQLYLAFSKNTPDDVITKWQAALDAMKSDGSYEAIVKSYL